jgi:hypothetical protein
MQHDNDVAERPDFSDDEDEKFVYDSEKPPAENEEVEADTTEDDSPSSENETADEDADTEAEDDGDDSDGDDTDIEEPEVEAKPDQRKTPRAEKRIRELAQQNKALIEQLKAAPAVDPNLTRDENGQPPQFPTYAEGEEVTPDRLQRDVVQTSKTIAEALVKRELTEYHARQENIARAEKFQSDLTSVETKYEALNPDSAQHDAVLTKKVFELYSEASDGGKRPVALGKFVDNLMDLADASATKRSAEVKTTLDKQAANAAITPTTAPKRQKSFSQLSDEEMESRLGWA